MYFDYGYYYPPYVPVAVRRARAAKEMAKRKKAGKNISPVVVSGRKIATTFWGESWCTNLERYSDFENRLPRGRTYVRNGSVVHLEIASSKVVATVVGSEIYEVSVHVKPVPARHWRALREDCVGSIASLVELLRGELSDDVMERMCREGTGLFPSPKEIRFTCSCPDYADMCKHVAAVLYGVGTRLDRSPELLFRLRAVDEKDLIASAGTSLPGTKKKPSSKRVLGGADLSAVFGVEMAGATPERTEAPPPHPVEAKSVRKSKVRRPPGKRSKP